MCKGLSNLPSSCLEKAKGIRMKLSHLADKPEWAHKQKSQRIFQDLQSLLNSKAGLHAFRGFLHSEFSEENLEFWLACEEYRCSSKNQREIKAQTIYNQFINPEAPQEVNLDSETKEALTNLILRPKADTFDKAQHSIYILMAKDSFPRFLRSSYCQETLKTL